MENIWSGKSFSFFQSTRSLDLKLTPTMFVMEMLMINAARGFANPGVEKNFPTDSIKGGSVSPFANFSISELYYDGERHNLYEHASND